MNFKLNNNASVFIKGAIEHIIKKKVSWDKLGITCIKYFNINDDYVGSDSAFPIGRRIFRIPKSNIRNKDINSAVPFTNLNEKIKPVNGLVRQKSTRYNYCDN
tara:strand:- start:340 stop:648 length:309 start_codon:yes stop_codon:yes gene_type:complete